MIGEHSRIIEKDQLTCDHSYNWQSKWFHECLNEKGALGTLLVWWFDRIINWTVVACLKFPDTLIMATKVDSGSAYILGYQGKLEYSFHCSQENFTIMPICLTIDCLSNGE